MIKSVTVTNHLGETAKINLRDDDPEHGMIISSITGLGPPKANVNMTNLSTMDGSIFNSANVEKRNIVISMLFTYANTIEETRLNTYKYFPIKKPVKIVIETDNRLVETTGIVETNEPDIFSKDESNQISIICEDPYFHSVEDNVVTMFTGVNPMFEFEFSNESLYYPLLEFSEIQESSKITVFYEGDSEVGLIINLHATGNVGNVTIHNTDTKEMMKIYANKIERITGKGIIPGDDIIISTVKGNKFIRLLRSGTYTNILNACDKNSDWFQLANGENNFGFIIDEGPENLIITFDNKIIYEGV